MNQIMNIKSVVISQAFLQKLFIKTVSFNSSVLKLNMNILKCMLLLIQSSEMFPSKTLKID